jgi:hypothetical protein
MTSRRSELLAIPQPGLRALDARHGNLRKLLTDGKHLHAPRDEMTSRVDSPFVNHLNYRWYKIW